MFYNNELLIFLHQNFEFNLTFFLVQKCFREASCDIFFGAFNFRSLTSKIFVPKTSEAEILLRINNCHATWSECRLKELLE